MDRLESDEQMNRILDASDLEGHALQTSDGSTV